MKKALLLFLSQVWAVVTIAQQQPVKSSIRLGVDFMTLDAPDATGLRYQARYAKHILKDRLLLAASLGYFRKTNQQNLYRDIYTDGNIRRRLTSDLSLLADLLPSPRRALRVGGGLSAWYRKDNIWTSISYAIDLNSGNIVDLRTSRYRLNEWNTGFHFTLEYEQAITNQLAIGGRVGFANLRQASTSVQAGLGVSYQLH